MIIPQIKTKNNKMIISNQINKMKIYQINKMKIIKIFKIIK